MKVARALSGGAVTALTVAGTASELIYAPTPSPPVAGAVALALLACVPLLIQRERPVHASLGVAAVALAYHLLGYPGLAPAFPLCFTLYAVTADARARWPLPVALAAAVCLIPALPPAAIPPTSLAVLGPLTGLSWIVALGASARQRVAGRLAEERLAVAREIHDVLAHTISVITVHSAVALDALDGDPAQARAALLRVRAAAKEVRPQVRAALGALRGSSAEPQPGLERLPELVRSAGIPVTLSVTPVAVPRLLQLTAYRIVQEALSNVVQHAAASRAAVAVRVDGGALVVDVVDDGAARPSVQPGYGLSGMRERAALVGGTLSAGPDPGGGFRVHAELPLEAP